MFYSRMAEHAIRALGELARLRDEYVSTGLIAELTPTPTPILTKVIARLSHAGLVRTREGRHGGVRLARPPSAITVCEVVTAFDGDEVLPVCPVFSQGCNCLETQLCRLHVLWTEAREAAFRFLEGITIADVAVALDRQPRQRRSPPE